MPRPRLISEQQRMRIAAVAIERRRLPSDKDLAAESGVTVSAIRKIMRELVQSMTVSPGTRSAHDPRA